MPEGDRRGEVDFHDYTYDGVKKDGMLYKGLGQLADGEYGQDNFRLDLRGRGIKVKSADPVIYHTVIFVPISFRCCFPSSYSTMGAMRPSPF